MSTPRERHTRARRKRPVLHSEAGITGSGRNITAAKADWLAKVKVALEGTFTPIRVTVHGLTAFVWREREGWCYKILRGLKPDESKEVLYGCGMMVGTRDDAERAARAHLAQNLFIKYICTGMSAIINEEDRKDHARWVEWQYCFAAWVDTGMTQDKAHNAARPDNWPDGITPISAWGLPG